MSNVLSYLSLVTSEHADKPNFVAWLTAFLQKVDDAVSAAGGLDGDFDLDTAVGAQLDIIGTIVGVSRTLTFQLSGGVSPILDDIHFRILIQAAIARNQWDGTIPGLYALWESVFGASSQLQIIDNQNMTMQAVVTGLDDVVSAQLVNAGFIIPKPMTVALTIVEQTAIATVMGWGALVNALDTYALSVPAPV